MIHREDYLQQLIALRDKQVIKIITGIRRCGKSTLLELYQQYLRGQGVGADRIIALNFEDFDNDPLLDPKALHRYVADRLAADGMNYIFLDEIQMVSDFQRVIDSLHIRKNVDIYVTGSNDDVPIYSTVILKDVMGRFKIADSMMLESVVRFLFDNIGNQLSTKKISDSMTSDGRKIDVKTVEKYLRALQDSYIIYQAKRYNVKGRSYLKTLEKYYVVDTALRGMLLGGKGADVGHILENVVYLELLRRGYTVFVGKLDEREVDFVAMNDQGTAYFQVAATVRDSATFAREIQPLKKIPDDHPKCILTLDNDPDANFDGIKRRNALTWLMQ